MLEAQFSGDVIEQSIGQMNSPWFRYFLQHDPRPALERIEVPVLSLTGRKDLQVPAELEDPELTRLWSVVAIATRRCGRSTD